jgi:hypothetical protein
MNSCIFSQVRAMVSANSLPYRSARKHIMQSDAGIGPLTRPVVLRAVLPSKRSQS